MGQILRIAAPSALQMIGGVAISFAFIGWRRLRESVQAAYASGCASAWWCRWSASVGRRGLHAGGPGLGAGKPRGLGGHRVGLGVHGSLMGLFALGLLAFREPINDPLQ